MKKNILNFQSAMFEIRTILLSDPLIRKLLYFDGKDAYDKKEIPTIEQLLYDANGKDANYITLFPIMEKGVKEYSRNTYIQITLPVLDLDTEGNGDNLFAGIIITVVTDKEHYVLNNNHLRLFELCNRIIALVDDFKGSPAGKLDIIKMEGIIFDTEVYGYNLKVMVTDMGEGVDF